MKHTDHLILGDPGDKIHRSDEWEIFTESTESEEHFLDESQRHDIMTAFDPDELRQIVRRVLLGLDFEIDDEVNIEDDMEHIVAMIDAGKVLTIRDDSSISSHDVRFVHDERVLGAVKWLCTQAASEDNHIGRTIEQIFLRRRIRNSADEAIARLEEETGGEEGALSFSKQPMFVISENTKGIKDYLRLMYIFNNITDYEKTNVSRMDLKRRLAESVTHTADLVATALMNKILRKKLGKTQAYVQNVLGYDIESGGDVDGDELSSVVVSVIQSLNSPRGFIIKHREGLQELASLDRARFDDPKKSQLYYKRVTSFLAFASETYYAQQDQESDLAVSDEELRNDAIDAVAELGGTSKLNNLARAVARELNANPQVTEDDIFTIYEGMVGIIADAHQNRRNSNGYARAIDEIESLMRGVNAVFDDGVLRKSLRIAEDF